MDKDSSVPVKDFPVKESQYSKCLFFSAIFSHWDTQSCQSPAATGRAVNSGMMQGEEQRIYRGNSSTGYF